jgi:hypothetical protein
LKNTLTRAIRPSSFGPVGWRAVDLEFFGQLDVAQSGVHVRDPVHGQPMAAQIRQYLAKVGHVMRLALDNVAERALAKQAFLGDGVGQSVPVVSGQAFQVALDHGGFRRVTHVVST